MSVASDVDRGLELRSEIAEREAELKSIVARLEKAALTGEQVPLEDGDREGRQYLAQGNRGTVPVIITSDELMGSFADGSPAHEKVKASAGDWLPNFYKRTVKFERVFDNGKAFRLRAAELYGDKAPAFISACLARDKHGIPKSKVVVQWDRLREVAA